jgi:type III pantothenate kinase
MNLVADIGNSYIKSAIFDNDKIIESFRFTVKQSNDFLKKLKNIKKRFPEIDNFILSSVKKEDSDLKDAFQNLFKNYIFFDDKTPIPIKNLYKTPKSLGKDRLAGVIAAGNIFPSANVLVIDCGTALTIDLINKKLEYIGGSITPGLLMRYKALNYFTDKLPNIQFDEDYDKVTGLTTEESIRSGVQNGILHEVEGYIEKYSEKYPDLKVTITGGDTFFFERRIKKQIFAEPNLILIGLNLILKHNAK